jgi:hypothetical protein
VQQPNWIQWQREDLQGLQPNGVSSVSMAEPTVPALPAMSVSFREEDVNLSLLPEDSRDIESQAFVDAVFALYQEPYEGMEGSFSCSYTEGLFEISWIPLGDPGTELMQVRLLLEAEPHVHRLEPLHPAALTLLTMQNGVPMAAAPVRPPGGTAATP